MMDASVGSLAAPTSLDEPLVQVRDLPQINRLHIPPLRDPVPSRSLRVPSPLEPNADGPRESAIPRNGLINSNAPGELRTLADFLHVARTNSLNQSVTDTLPHPEPPPKTIQPAFINLRAVEKLPYSSFEDEVPRKHRRLDLQGDGFGEHLQLPIPNIQKGAAKPPPFGPLTILNGLNEPPPNAALFPPIEPDSVTNILTRPTKDTSTPVEQVAPDATEERRGRRIDEIIDTNSEDVDGQQASKNAGQETQRIAKPAAEEEKTAPPQKVGFKPRKRLRKWTEQETTDLLRGVLKCGVGNWTAILAQPELKFDNRTAGNLKDRFRVCCPWAYGPDQKPNSEAVQTSLAEAVNGSELLCGKIVLPDPRHVKSSGDSTGSCVNFSKTTHSSATVGNIHPQTSAGADDTGNNPSTSATSQRGTKHQAAPDDSQSLPNKTKSTLKSLGLSEPHLIVRSNRRSRRPFTPAEDEALLKGYAVHGFQWTLIQQDKHLNLMHRRATDLRDRFRTKFPNAYREGGSATAKVIKANGKDSDHVPAATSTSATGPLPMIGEKPRPMDVSTSSQPSSNDHSSIPVDHVVHPPVPPSNAPESSNAGSTSIIPFLLDDGGHSGGDNSDMRWTDNTLPPLVWDEFG